MKEHQFNMDAHFKLFNANVFVIMLLINNFNFYLLIIIKLNY